MAAFQYIIKDVKGARSEGIIKATSLDEAVDKLTAEGNTVITVKTAAEGSFRGKMSIFDKLMLQIYKWRTGVGLRTLVFFTRQMATMFSAGLTIERSISNLEKSEKNNKFRKVLVKIANDIKKGYSLSEALEEHPGIFNPLYISLVKAGEVSGTMHTILDELAEYLEKLEDTKRKVSTALTYPTFILCFLVIVAFCLFYFIIPMFARVYEDFDADLPMPTQIAIFIADWIGANVFYFFLIILGLVMTVFIIYLSDRGRYIIDRMTLHFPVIGGLMKNSIMSKFARTFSILMTAGVPIMDTLELSQDVVQNAVVEKAVADARNMVKEGYTVAGAFKRTGIFPATLLQLIATGEETGDMDRLLAKAAEFYEKLVDSVIDRLSSLIEPILIVLMAAVVGTIVIVIYLPIFNLGLAISSGAK